jgi:DNA-directed RNA polymerase subunit RPC12/RpoP
MKFKEIEEKNRCPVCGYRLFYKSMPMRSENDMYKNAYTWPKNWYCDRCDKYFELIEENEL